MSKEDMMPKFVELSKKYESAVGITEINEIFDKQVADAKKRGVAEDKVEYIAWLTTQVAVHAKYGKKEEETKSSSGQRSEAADLEGFLVGFGDYRDKYAEMVKFIEKYIEKNGKVKAQAEGLIKTDGVTIINLDYRAEVFGKTNKNKGEVLKKEDVNTEMTVYGVFRRAETEDAFVFGVLSATDSAVANSWFKSLKFPDHLFVPLKTNGNIKETELGFKINASTAKDKVTKFTLDKHPSYDVDTAFNEAIGPLITPWNWEDGEEHDINPLYQHYLDALQAGKKDKNNIQRPDFNRMIFVKGMIDQIHPEWKNWKGTPAYLCNENDVVQRIKVSLPDGFEKMFGEGSIVVAYGKDEETMRKNEATGKWDIPSGRIEIRAVGAYPVPGFKTTPVESSKVKLKEFNAVVSE